MSGTGPLENAVTAAFAVGATARLTRLLTQDEWPPSVMLRMAVARRFGDESAVTYLSTCPWCAAPWVAAAVLPLVGRYPKARAVAGWLSAAYLASWVVVHDEH